MVDKEGNLWLLEQRIDGLKSVLRFSSIHVRNKIWKFTTSFTMTEKYREAQTWKYLTIGDLVKRTLMRDDLSSSINSFFFLLIYIILHTFLSRLISIQ